MHCGIVLTNREIKERLDRQRNTRTFMMREGMRPFPARTTWCLWLASGVGSMYRKLYYPSVVSELLLDMCVNLNFPRLVMPWRSMLDLLIYDWSSSMLCFIPGLWILAIVFVIMQACLHFFIPLIV
jgi:hypothetical protein